MTRDGWVEYGRRKSELSGNLSPDDYEAACEQILDEIESNPPERGEVAPPIDFHDD